MRVIFSSANHSSFSLFLTRAPHSTIEKKRTLV
jgi:hypothetical protein